MVRFISSLYTFQTIIAMSYLFLVVSNYREQEIQDKEDEKKEQHEKLMERVLRDFAERKGY